MDAGRFPKAILTISTSGEKIITTSDEEMERKLKTVTGLKEEEVEEEEEEEM
jgi:hypothetical protein